MRQQASWPGRRHGVAHLYDTRTGLSCDRPGPTCKSNVLKRPASVREERVLCKSILSPQREPKGESIIRRFKPPMLPNVRDRFSQFLPVGKKFPKSFPEIRPRSFGLMGQPFDDPRVATLLATGIYPRAAKVSEPHPNCFAIRLVQAVLLHASLLQRNYSGDDCRRSITFLKL